MPVDPLPWRYRDDSYYRKGSFSVEFRIEPQRAAAEFADATESDPRRRALQQLLLALRDETGLKISTFVDVWDANDAAEDVEDGEPDQEAAQYRSAEFVIYNKLGVTSLSKLRRFMDDHLKGDVSPRVILIDPETNERFSCTWFTIRYLFHEFVAHHQPNDWERLRELMGQEDRGYGELMRSRARHAARLPRSARLHRVGNRPVRGNTILFRGHLYRTEQ